MAMEAVIFMGLQAAGKTTFYHGRFSTTHVRVSLDDLKTRAREMTTVQGAIANRRSFVVDNTNPTVQERKRYIQLAKAAQYFVVGYYFEPDIAGSLRRNASRRERDCIPVPGLFRTRKRLQVPSFEEGFDSLYKVRLGEDGRFKIEEWPIEDTRSAPERSGGPHAAEAPKVTVKLPDQV